MRPNQSVRDLNNSINSSKLNNSVPNEALGQNNSGEKSQGKPDLEKDADLGLNEEDENSDQLDQRKDLDQPSDEVSDTENLSDSLGNQLP